MKKLLIWGGIAATLGIIACVVLVFIGALVSPPEQRTTAARSNESANQQAVDAPVPTAEPGPPYETIRSEMEGMTEAQFKNYAREIKGKQVTWTGWVEDVNEKTFGGYELWVDMDSPDEVVSLQDVQFNVSDNLALSFELDQPVTFTGTIDTVTNFLGSTQITLSDVAVQ